MKKIIFTILGCFSFSTCCAHEFQEHNGRLYVPPGTVYVASDAIYINMHGNFIPVEGIASDTNGVYITDTDFDKGARRFYCLKCGKYHSLREGCPKA